jgi:hypothetical protein
MESLQAFAREIIRLSWYDAPDGADIQEAAEKHGLIRRKPHDPKDDGEVDYAEPGDDIFVFTELLK